MVTYIYFVKCPNCEDEPFDFFDEAKAFARSCMSQKPVITQVEVSRNDFGECTDSTDFGQIWSWEDEAEPEDEVTTFSRDDIKSDYDPDNDPEFADDDFFTINAEEPVVVPTEESDTKEPITEAKTDPFHEAIFEAIDYLTDFDYMFPVPENIGATNWEELKDDIRYGLSSDFEIAEIIMEYLDKDLAISRKHPEMFEDDPQSELTLETYNRLKRAYDRAVAKYEADHSEDFEEAFRYDRLRDKEYDDALDALDRPLPEYRYTLDPETGKYTAELVNRDQFTDDELKKFESCERKPIPEGMTIEQIVEEMEKNEDHVECKHCGELCDKSNCSFEESLHGYVCEACKSAGDTKVLSEDSSNEKSTYEANEEIEFYYDDLTKTCFGTQRDVDVFDDDWEYTGSYSYYCNAQEVAETIWDVFVTIEDIEELTGQTIDDEMFNFETREEFDAFMNEHFDTLLAKYWDKLEDYYKDNAQEEFEDSDAGYDDDDY